MRSVDPDALRDIRDDPSLIPTEDFEDNGRTYRLFDMTWEESDGRVLYTAIFNKIESY